MPAREAWKPGAEDALRRNHPYDKIAFLNAVFTASSM
jgi:hypothetical protein